MICLPDALSVMGSWLSSLASGSEEARLPPRRARSRNMVPAILKRVFLAVVLAAFGVPIY
jgi:hypothetical protein